MSKPRYIFELKEIENDDAQEVGSKAANLSEMAQLGFPIPQGFVISLRACEDFIEQNNLNKSIKDITKIVNKENIKEAQSASSSFSRLIQKASFPEELKEEILEAYSKLGGLFKQAHVAVRPSPISQDSAKSNALGHLNTSLDIQGEASLLETVKKYWSTGAGVAIIVQKMVEAESAGVAFTIDPTDGNKHRMLIEAVWGQGELLTSGQISPDKYLLERHSLKIEDVSVTPQKHQLVLTGNSIHTKEVSVRKQKKQKLTFDQITSLAKVLQMVHAHYYFPYDVEWAYSQGKFYILHARPVTTTDQETPDSNQLAIESRKLNAVLLKGQGASPGIVRGHVRIIKSGKDLSKVKKGEILVFEKITPDLIPFFKLAGGVVTNQGGVTSHAAIITREIGIPCVVGVDDATRKLKDGEVVTLNGSNGEVTENTWKTDQKKEKQLEVKIKPNQEIKTVTKIYLNLAVPEEAREAAKLPSAGIGLLRAEFMISEFGVHPRHVIAQGRQKEYVDKLKEGIEKFCSAFSPRPVIYRTTDFKSNEYRNLQGGKTFEPEEDNPMLGFRGAFRYVADPEVFELELAAVRLVREKYKNLHMMIPYVRSPEELLHVKRIMAAAGLYRGASFKLWMMIELPINVIMIEDFLRTGIDGVSFGSNDLTMLLLGTDRDNNDVREAYIELSPAVFWALERVVKACKKYKIETSICGAAVSVYDTLIEKLVGLGIGSISVSSDSLGRVQKVIQDAERRL